MCESYKEDNNPAFDESCYNKIFAYEFPLTRFVSVGSATKVEKRVSGLPDPVQQVFDNPAIVRFRDRDDLTSEEIEKKRAEGIRVMSKFRNIESMLLSDGVLHRLCEKHGKPDRFTLIQTARDTALKNITGSHASDDLKPVAQAVYQEVRKQLRLRQKSNSKEDFMRDVLVPLITPDTPEYEILKRDIFG